MWFNAPHGPWEVLRTGEQLYDEKYGKTADDWAKTKCGNDNLRDQQRWQYKTMVSFVTTINLQLKLLIFVYYEYVYI